MCRKWIVRDCAHPRYTFTCMIRKLYRVYWIHIKAKELQGKDGRFVANIPLNWSNQRMRRAGYQIRKWKCSMILALKQNRSRLFWLNKSWIKHKLVTARHTKDKAVITTDPSHKRLCHHLLGDIHANDVHKRLRQCLVHSRDSWDHACTILYVWHQHMKGRPNLNLQYMQQPISRLNRP